MKINTLVIDDDPHWRVIIGKFVEMNPLLNLVATCKSAMEGYGLLAEKDIDLLICDIEMPDFSGLSFVKSLSSPPLVIFVTAHRDYALVCYEVSPVDFLMKPLDYEHFLKAVEKVRQKQANKLDSSKIEPYFFVRQNLIYIQIAYRDVLYMESHQNFVKIITHDRTFFPILTITKSEEQLKHDIFLRVHRSYIVHRGAIASIGKNEIVLINGHKIPIGDQYRHNINQKHIDAYSIFRSN